MIALFLTLAVLAVTAFIIIASLFAVAAVFHAVLWLLFLPFRLLFGLLFLPFILLKVVIGAVLFLVLAPIIAIAGIGALIATAAAITVPLFPLICIAFVVWVVMRPNRRAVA